MYGFLWDRCPQTVDVNFFEPHLPPEEHTVLRGSGAAILDFPAIGAYLRTVDRVTIRQLRGCGQVSTSV